MDALWKFVCASDYTSNGNYSTRGLYTLGNKELEIIFIKENLKNVLKEHIKLFNNKEIEFWSRIPYFWIIQDVNKYPVIIIKVIAFIDKFIIIFITLLSFYGILKKKEKNKLGKVNFIYLAICANFFVYQLVEVQARYAYIAKIFLFLLAMDGLDKFYTRNKTKKAYKM